jgi:ADP-heptose:LPS heptosyltransferase
LLIERLDCTVLLIGSRPQQSALDHIVQASNLHPRVKNLAGQTGWNDVPGILRSADLVICNNSGVAHLAASLGVRTLAIYSASHQPQEWGPRGAQARALMAVVPCSPCGFDRLEACHNNHACMRGLMPETVLAQAASWLDEN